MKNKKKINKDDKAEKEMEKTKRKLSSVMERQSAKRRNDYITNTVNGRYFLERVNMLAEQINNGVSLEDVDGCPKPTSYLRAEYALFKVRAITCLREAHFAKEDLKNEYKYTDEDIDAIEEDYYNGKVVRENYDETYRRQNKAGFVKTSEEDKKS